jgi:hypothetical protein
VCPANNPILAAERFQARPPGAAAALSDEYRRYTSRKRLTVAPSVQTCPAMPLQKKENGRGANFWYLAPSRSNAFARIDMPEPATRSLTVTTKARGRSLAGRRNGPLCQSDRRYGRGRSQARASSCSYSARSTDCRRSRKPAGTALERAWKQTGLKICAVKPSGL